MSSPSAFCDSLMNTAHVVCIDQSESRPSLTPVRRTNAITVSVRSTSSSRSVVSISMVSATTASPPTAADVALGTGVSRTVTTELLLITLHSILAAHGPEQGRAGLAGAAASKGDSIRLLPGHGREVGEKPTRSRHCERAIRKSGYVLSWANHYRCARHLGGESHCPLPPRTFRSATRRARRWSSTRSVFV